MIFDLFLVTLQDLINLKLGLVISKIKIIKNSFLKLNKIIIIKKTK